LDDPVDLRAQPVELFCVTGEFEVRRGHGSLLVESTRDARHWKR
jgi:hypothetical protein